MNDPEKEFRVKEKLVEYWNDLDNEKQVAYVVLAAAIALIWTALFFFWMQWAFLGLGSIITAVIGLIVALFLVLY